MKPALKKLNIPSAWTSDDLKNSQDWAYHFTSSDIAEVHQALSNIKKNNLAAEQITKSNFNLPTLGKKLEAFANEIKFQRGFKVLKGFPVEQYSVEESSIIFWGICKYIGTPVPQSAAGQMLYYVKDLKKEGAKRYSETNSRLPFHTDGSDIISLFCYRAAANGGLSKFVSSVAIFNRMLETKPEYAELLCNPLHPTMLMDSTVCKDFTEYERVLPFALPIFNFKNDLPVNRYAAGYITSAINRKTVPPITEEQTQALTELNRLANDESLHYALQLEAGDMEFFNNNYVFHARTEYEDGQNDDESRCIIRIWLDAPEVETIPPLFGYGVQ